jgi:hypothetical protein
MSLWFVVGSQFAPSSPLLLRGQASALCTTHLVTQLVSEREFEYLPTVFELQYICIDDHDAQSPRILRRLLAKNSES